MASLSVADALQALETMTMGNPEASSQSGLGSEEHLVGDGDVHGGLGDEEGDEEACHEPDARRPRELGGKKTTTPPVP